jgi:hypothetical protein
LAVHYARTTAPVVVVRRALHACSRGDRRTDVFDPPRCPRRCRSPMGSSGNSFA